MRCGTARKWSVQLQNICGGYQYVQMVSSGFVNVAEDHFGDPTTVFNHPYGVTVLVRRKYDLIAN